jgi:hypothetical protein
VGLSLAPLTPSLAKEGIGCAPVWATPTPVCRNFARWARDRVSRARSKLCRETPARARPRLVPAKNRNLAITGNTKCPFAELFFKPSDGLERVFDINADATAKRLHDRLHEVSETYRNTYGHGGFDKEGGSIYFHVPEVGALPARLTHVRDSPHFDLIPVDSLDFEEVCALFDEVDEFLATSEVTRFGVRYAEAGMDVHYDERSRRRFAEAMESHERFEELLDHDSYVETMAMNMDW